MRRPFLAILLIANLLVCPLRCFSCQAETAAETTCISSACDCCHAAEQPSDCDPGSGDDPAPSEECSCPDCICEGATIQSAPEIAQDVAQPAHFFDWNDRLAIRMDRLSNRRSSELDLLPDRFFSGRDARVARQSWLI